ncbi:MAG: threonine ammonia-lyase IlvA [Rhodospirillales bacterium]|nr:threonine ammonia-lyase IlvA [Rhodospirillales bacterium]MBO6787010.1 threonine ammonia-lyase IlvA [Rhodospirillales bacterium]
MNSNANTTDKTGVLSAAKDALESLAEVMEPTLLQQNLFLSDRYGAKIYLKREDLTPVRSYKLRGAFNFFRKALAGGHRPPGFVCASAGNHAQGFAFACHHFDIPGVVFMPVTTPQQKIDKTYAFGQGKVEVKLIGDIFDVCNREALDYAERNGWMMVPPFDHEDIIEGQSTVGLELLNQADFPVDLLILPVGGGGLSSGVRRIMQAASPDTEIVYVEPAGAPSLKRSLEKGERVVLREVDNFVDGASVAAIGERNFDSLRDVDPDAVMLIDEDELCETIVEFLNREGIVLEPAGALAIHALRYVPAEKLAGRNVVCVTSGGNFDFERLPEVKERALRAAGLKKYLILRLPQRPGALKDFLNILGPADDITRFEYLKKSARNFGHILIGIESREQGSFDALFQRMDELGYTYSDITEDEAVANFIV